MSTARVTRRRPAVSSRVVAITALAVAIAAVAVLVTRSTSYRYALDFTDAGQLVTGDQVRIGGNVAGSVDSIQITSNGLAQIGISLDDSYGPLHTGTTAQIRSPGLTGIASRYIDIQPGSPLEPQLPTGATLPTTTTSGIVDIDEVFDALDGNTRIGLRRLIRGFSAWYDGRSAQANATSAYLPAALAAYQHLFTQLDASTPALDAFIDRTAAVLGSVDARAPQLSDLIEQGNATVTALASDNRSLSTGLADLPPALRQGSNAFAGLRTTALPALRRLFAALEPATPALAKLLPHLNPVLTKAVPVFALLSRTFDAPGAHDDLYDALLQLPQLGRDARADLPEATRALDQSLPIFESARPYTPDLVGWLTSWDGIFAPYDANGHYARLVPELGAFSLSGSGSDESLSQVPPSMRGRDGTIASGVLRRCPGSAAVGSEPFVDSGPLANVHCDPAETLP